MLISINGFTGIWTAFNDSWFDCYLELGSTLWIGFVEIIKCNIGIVPVL